MSTVERSLTRKPNLTWRHLFLILTGSGAGIGCWLCWGHLPPWQQTLIHAGVPRTTPASEGRAVLANGNARSRLPRPTPDPFSEHGAYIVRINEIRLDPTVFKGGHTVDIQVRVLKKGFDGQETDAWESKTYGRRLAMVGRDELVAGWSDAPFEVVWNPGDRFFVEVYDRKGFLDANSFVMEASADHDFHFPLRSGAHSLRLVERNRSSNDSTASRIVIESVAKVAHSTTAEATEPIREPLETAKGSRQTASKNAPSRMIADRNVQTR